MSESFFFCGVGYDTCWCCEKPQCLRSPLMLFFRTHSFVVRISFGQPETYIDCRIVSLLRSKDNPACSHQFLLTIHQTPAKMMNFHEFAWDPHWFGDLKMFKAPFFGGSPSRLPHWGFEPWRPAFRRARPLWWEADSEAGSWCRAAMVSAVGWGTLGALGGYEKKPNEVKGDETNQSLMSRHALSRHVGRQHCGGERWTCGVASRILRFYCELVPKIIIFAIFCWWPAFFLGKAPIFGQVHSATCQVLPGRSDSSRAEDKSSFCGGNSTKATSGINGAGGVRGPERFQILLKRWFAWKWGGTPQIC